MLLGQIVAISFATNLFLVTLLLSSSTPVSPPSSRAQRPQWLGPWLLNLGSIVATTVPAYLLSDDHYWHHSEDFLPVLLAPHIALLVLPFARVLVPTRYFPENGAAFDNKVYPYMWALTCGSAASMLCWTTAKAVSYGGFEGIWSALLEHPAVSSVGFDVVFCWITWVCWFCTPDGRTGLTSRRSVGEAEDARTDNGVGTAVQSNSVDGVTRRR
jgi:hypothetical protein